MMVCISNQSIPACLLRVSSHFPMNMASNYFSCSNSVPIQGPQPPPTPCCMNTKKRANFEDRDRGGHRALMHMHQASRCQRPWESERKQHYRCAGTEHSNSRAEAENWTPCRKARGQLTPAGFVSHPCETRGSTTHMGSQNPPGDMLSPVSAASSCTGRSMFRGRYGLCRPPILAGG